jgi:hypothetical protein
MKKLYVGLIAFALLTMAFAAPMGAASLDNSTPTITAHALNMQVIETVSAVPETPVYVDSQVLVIDNLFVPAVVYKPPGVLAKANMETTNTSSAGEVT